MSLCNGLQVQVPWDRCLSKKRGLPKLSGYDTFVCRQLNDLPYVYTSDRDQPAYSHHAWVDDNIDDGIPVRDRLSLMSGRDSLRF
jgi:hypothetical protein